METTGTVVDSTAQQKSKDKSEIKLPKKRRIRNQAIRITFFATLPLTWPVVYILGIRHKSKI